MDFICLNYYWGNCELCLGGEMKKQFKIFLLDYTYFFCNFLLFLKANNKNNPNVMLNKAVANYRSISLY